MKGLLIKTPWIDKILAGTKTWELRGSNTHVRGKIALIQSGSGTVVGTCELVNVVGPLSKAELTRRTRKHGVSPSLLRQGVRYRKTYAWVLEKARRLRRPVPYKHPMGAVIWVNLPDGILGRPRV